MGHANRNSSVRRRSFLGLLPAGLAACSPLGVLNGVAVPSDGYRVLAGETYLHKEMEKLLLQNSLGIKQETNYIPKLSRREQEVLDLIAKEHTSQEIADLLFVSVNTVETHRASLLSKFGARNIAGLVKAALEKGLIN